MRLARLIFETLLYGTAYGSLNYLITSPVPLPEERTWHRITAREPPLRRWLRKNWPPAFLRPLILRRFARMAMEEAIPKIYDVSNDFYALFLDKRYMFYSCADHERGDETLEEAQANKARFLLDLMKPKAGQKILELGCGWGSMMRAVVERTGDKDNLVGYTLSSAQRDYIARNLGFNVRLANFVTSEFPAEEYDTLYSIGAWEAIRGHEAPALLRRLYATLKPGGRFVLHFFCRLAEPLPPTVAAAQLFWPGHVPLSYGQTAQEFERAGFRIEHTSVHDYRPTLRQWFDRLVANKDAAIRAAGVEAYNRHVVLFAVSHRYFDERTGALFRFALRKPAAA